MKIIWVWLDRAFSALFGTRVVADAKGKHARRFRVYLEGQDISGDCYLAKSYFDGSLVIAWCFVKNSANEFVLNPDRSDVEREVRVGIGRIMKVI